MISEHVLIWGSPLKRMMWISLHLSNASFLLFGSISQQLDMGPPLKGMQLCWAAYFLRNYFAVLQWWLFNLLLLKNYDDNPTTLCVPEAQWLCLNPICNLKWMPHWLFTPFPEGSKLASAVTLVSNLFLNVCFWLAVYDDFCLKHWESLWIRVKENFFLMRHQNVWLVCPWMFHSKNRLHLSSQVAALIHKG